MRYFVLTIGSERNILMKAIIEESDGLYIIRINGNEGSLYDVYVVEEIELKNGKSSHQKPLVVNRDVLSKRCLLVKK